mmetsp:Transcript_18671/g.59103  ORF Transcript_18671/g.59103 Transcript_18671/m.59103 type:complete len:127 (+) Transcript_18671:502-882(+)
MYRRARTPGGAAVGADRSLDILVRVQVHRLSSCLQKLGCLEKLNVSLRFRPFLLLLGAHACLYIMFRPSHTALRSASVLNVAYASQTSIGICGSSLAKAAASARQPVREVRPFTFTSLSSPPRLCT